VASDMLSKVVPYQPTLRPVSTLYILLQIATQFQHAASI